MKHKLILSLLLVALLLVLSPAVRASTMWYVDGVHGSDGNDCKSPQTACKTIGHAISLASSGDAIMVAAATYTENLNIALNLTIVGSGSTATIIDGGGVNTVVTIPNTAANVALSRVTIRDGSARNGGGIYSSGTLMIDHSTIFRNSATGSGRMAGFGGGIYNNGATLTISNSTLSENFVNGFGAGIFNFKGALTINDSTLSRNSAVAAFGPGGGGITNDFGVLTINNSTLSGNSMDLASGGGISNFGVMLISNSTLSGNKATYPGRGGGIFNSFSASATLQNSIVANSIRRGNCDGSITSNGYNLSSDNTCNFNNTGDLNSTDPKLGPLMNNGGPTHTMALLPGSPAIDTGNPSGCNDGQGHLLKADQRGAARPDHEDSGGCDRGAYERQGD